MNPGARLLGEMEVVLDQRVLRTDSAAGHTSPAFRATCAFGSFSAEERVRHGNSCLPEENTDGGGGREGLPHAHLFGYVLHHRIGRSEGRIGANTQHPFGLVVVRRQFVVPVSDVRPLTVFEEPIGWLIQRVGVVQRPTSDAGPRHHEHIRKKMDALNPITSDPRRPQVLSKSPTGFRQLVVGKPSTGFEHPDAVALLRQAKSGDTATESRTDNHHVVVRSGHASTLSILRAE